jgi:predicted ArsR family transcriptional regulator
VVAPQHAGGPAFRPQLRELVQRQARALGDPTRFAIYQYISESATPVRVAPLAAHFQFNPTAIRQHLAKLCAARLLVEESAPAGAGRPPRQYRVAPTAMGTWGSPGPYELLSVLLLEVAGGGREPAAAGRDAGRRIAADYRAGADPLDVIEAEMARRGFEPRRGVDRGGDVEFVFDRCPFQAAAAADPSTVCAIHWGLAQGLLDAVGAGVEVGALEAYDPADAGCRLHVRPVVEEARPA